LSAAAIASVATGAPITTHTDQGTLGLEQQAFLFDRGVSPQRIIIGHSCGSKDLDYHMRILGKGCSLGFDRFGLDMLVPDEQRVDALVELLARGQERGTVISHDSVWCTRGLPIPQEMIDAMSPDKCFDPTHFHRNVIPRLLERGVDRMQIDMMLVDNPRRFFKGAGPGQ
jgi:phosphotriesterase-related protein